MHIVVTDGDTVQGQGVDLDFLRTFGRVTVYGLTKPEEIADRLADADAVLVNKTVLSADVLAAAPRLRYIGLFATGYNNIDTTYAASHGITVCNVPGYSTEAVAQHTMALLLQLTNQVGEYNRMVEQGDWVKSRTFSFFPLPLTELCGRTIGIVGYGAIGRRVAQIAMAFGMQVLVCNRSQVEDPTVQQVPFEVLLEQADVVSLHCPLNSDSENMMNAAAFARMKQGAWLINTARGALVDESALRAALDSGHLGGAGLDVLRQEPMASDCPLYGAPRCVLTPHIAWAGVETRRRLMDVVAQNLRAYLAGTPQNTV